MNPCFNEKKGKQKVYDLFWTIYRAVIKFSPQVITFYALSAGRELLFTQLGKSLLEQPCTSDQLDIREMVVQT